MNIKVRVIALVSIAAILFANPVTVPAKGLGSLQFMATAFLDVDALFPSTLKACAEIAPETVEPLTSLYSHWRKAQGVFQPELQRLIQEILIAEVGEEKTQKMLLHLKSSAVKLGKLHFPQDYHFKDNYFCTRLLPKDFNGKGAMLQFKDYVESLKNGTELP